MKLNVKDRILLLNVLPKEGNFVTLKITRKLEESLSFAEEEVKKYQFVTKENRVTWDLNAEQESDIEIGEKATDIIVDALKKLNEGNKLTNEYLDVYEKFVGEK